MSESGKLITLQVGDGTVMQAYIARPPGGKGPLPGLIVFQEAFGVNAHIRDVADRFAAEGYVVISPELFHRTAPAGFTCAYTDFPALRKHMDAIADEGLGHDVRAAWNWLEQQPDVRRGAMACIGYCLGGSTAFFANSIEPFKAAISYYGGSIAQKYLGRAPMLHAPMLFFWGGLDQHIPPEKVAAVTKALRDAGKPHINVEVSDADHGFFCDERPSFNPQAAREAWALTLAFLREKLGGEP